MAFENVRVSSFKTAVNNCITRLDTSEEENLIEKISNNNVWCTAARDHLKEAMENLINEEYANLKKDLQEAIKIGDIIENYQEYAEEVVRMEEELDDLYNEDDPSRSQIRYLKKQIRAYKQQMEVWKNQVANIVS